MAVYWLGADGNIYLKGDDRNVYNVGQPMGANPLQDQGFDSNQMSAKATRIDDPVNPRNTAPAPSNPTGASTPAAPALNQAAVNNTQATIDQLPGILQAALEAENQRFGNTMGGFNAQEQTQRGTYDKSTETNQLNYDANFMDSIRAGIKGLGGLMALLRGTGAAGGSVEGDVRDVVGGGTSQDIRTGHDTQEQNQGQLDSSLSQFLTDLGIKRKQNEDTRVNNEASLRRDNATQLQDLYGKMAGFYGDAGRTAERDTFMTRAGSLTPEIARNSAARVSAYDSTPVAVKAPEVTAFAAPTQPNVVAAPADGQVGSGIFTMSDTKRRRDRQAEQQVPVAVGA